MLRYKLSVFLKGEWLEISWLWSKKLRENTINAHEDTMSHQDNCTKYF